MTTVEIRPVTAADSDALARFSCRSLADPWTDEVETSIHHLADELERTDNIVARGVWTGEELLAVVVWRMVPDTPLCQSLVLAVQTGHRRRGYARMLKQRELDEARKSGCTVVISKVHWDNRPMLKLNKALGANIERINGDRDYAHCIIPL